MESDEHSVRPLRIPVRDWLVIDGTLDNEISVEAREGDPRKVVQPGRAIRKAGWDHLPDWPHEVAEFDYWPRPGQMVTMPLTTAQWDLVVSSLTRWDAVSDGLEDLESTNGEPLSRAIAERLRRQLSRKP